MQSLPFPQQDAAVASESALIAAFCSRRSGKTVGFLRKWRAVSAAKPGFMTPYVGLTRMSAKNIIWPVVKRMNRQLGWGLRFNETELRATDPNGSELYVLGANAAEEIDKLRGIPVPLVGVDEAQSFRDTVLTELLDDVVGPGLADLEGSQWVMGTPGLVPAGYFYRATTGQIPGYEVHAWTYLDNPHLPLDLPGRPLLTADEKRVRREAFLAKWLADRGYGDDHPTYQREWLGRWHRDTSAAVYAFNRDTHLDSLPADYWTRRSEWVHVIGIDYGYVDSTAWCVLAFRGYGADKTVWVVESFARPGLTPSQGADETHRLAEQYEAAIVVGDSGGLGKAYIEEARLRHALPIESADKLGKRAHIEHLNGDLRASPPRLRIVGDSNRQLCDELEVLQWDLRYPEDDPRWHTREDARFSNHLPDALLYAWWGVTRT